MERRIKGTIDACQTLVSRLPILVQLAQLSNLGLVHLVEVHSMGCIEHVVLVFVVNTLALIPYITQRTGRGTITFAEMPSKLVVIVQPRFSMSLATEPYPH